MTGMTYWNACFSSGTQDPWSRLYSYLIISTHSYGDHSLVSMRYLHDINHALDPQATTTRIADTLTLRAMLDLMSHSRWRAKELKQRLAPVTIHGRNVWPTVDDMARALQLSINSSSRIRAPLMAPVEVAIDGPYLFIINLTLQLAGQQNKMFLSSTTWPVNISSKAACKGEGSLDTGCQDLFHPCRLPTVALGFGWCILPPTLVRRTSLTE